MWPSYVMHDKSCERYWWSALLYVQNYVNPNEMVRINLIIQIV